MYMYVSLSGHYYTKVCSQGYTCSPFTGGRWVTPCWDSSAGSVCCCLLRVSKSSCGRKSLTAVGSGGALGDCGGRGSSRGPGSPREAASTGEMGLLRTSGIGARTVVTFGGGVAIAADTPTDLLFSHKRWRIERPTDKTCTVTSARKFAPRETSCPLNSKYKYTHAHNTTQVRWLACFHGNGNPRSHSTSERHWKFKMADVTKAKRRLAEALKEKITRYWELMKNWYKRKVTRKLPAPV